MQPIPVCKGVSSPAHSFQRDYYLLFRHGVSLNNQEVCTSSEYGCKISGNTVIARFFGGLGTLLNQLILLVACNFVASDVCLAQGQVLFFENFESGSNGWAFENSNFGLWHISTPGECYSVTRMAAYNRGPAGCHYTNGTSGNSGLLISPVFALSGLPPYRLSLDYVRSVGVTAATCLNIVIAECGQIAPVACFTEQSTAMRTATISLPSGYENRNVSIVFYFTTDSTGTNHPGFLVDNIDVRNSGIFGDFDGDLDVDADDFGLLVECYTGPPLPNTFCLPPPCAYGLYGFNPDVAGESCGPSPCAPPGRCGAIDCHTYDAFRLAWTAPGPAPDLSVCQWPGDVNRDGIVNIDDILCMFTCFSGDCACAGLIANADLSPCGGDGFINIDDLLAMLTAFGGITPCP